ncbi:universal stress protein [Hyphobacterium sp. CCMP332]|nr:universal stress protein [Hyphobacterium sp. CCMP332]
MKIIIPTDISESTLKALKFLSSFNSSKSIDVDLLYVFNGDKNAICHFSLRDWKLGKVDSNLFSKSQHQIIEEIVNNFSFITEIKCKNGSIEAEILAEANSGNYQMLLSATHGLNSLRDIVFGNVTQHLVNDSKIPVLSLPENYRISDSGRLLLISDFNVQEKSDFGNLRMLIDQLNLELHLLKIVDEGMAKETSIKSDIISYANSNKLKYDQMHIREGRTIEEGIHHFLEEFDISISAMATHARHGIKHFFLGSLTEELVDEINVPFYTFRIEA